MVYDVEKIVNFPSDTSSTNTGTISAPHRPQNTGFPCISVCQMCCAFCIFLLSSPFVSGSKYCISRRASRVANWKWPSQNIFLSLAKCPDHCFADSKNLFQYYATFTSRTRVFMRPWWSRVERGEGIWRPGGTFGNTATVKADSGATAPNLTGK